MPFINLFCQWGWRDYGMGPFMMWGWGFGWIFMIIFWGLVILGLIFFIRYLLSLPGAREKESALEILKKRYAKGEINKEEFEQKKKDLL